VVNSINSISSPKEFCLNSRMYNILQIRKLLLLEQKKCYNCFHRVLYEENQAQQSEE